MNLFKKFNSKETLLVVTSYPEDKKGKYGKPDLNAVGWHSERVLRNLSEKRKVLVMAEKTHGKKSFSKGKNIKVERIWGKGNIFSFFRLGKRIASYTEVKSVLIQFEFNVFGGILPNLALLTLILFLRLLGKRVTFEFHQVILDIKLLQKHINITNPIIQKFFNFSLKMYYLLAGLIVSEIIVFEFALKKRLSSYVRDEKIHALSLAVEKGKYIPKNRARSLVNKHISSPLKRLKKDEFILLVFGFINGYKGIDWITEKLKDNPLKKVRLLVVGGKNPYLADKPSYQKFYNGIISQIQKHNHMSYIDFVPEEDIPFYYNASDMAVIPYEVFMAASGPFSHTLSYGKPIIISEHLTGYTNSKDIQESIVKAEINTSDIIFKFTKSGLLRLVNRAKSDIVLYKKLQIFSKTLAEKRSMRGVSKSLDEILFPTISSSFITVTKHVKSATI